MTIDRRGADALDKKLCEDAAAKLTEPEYDSLTLREFNRGFDSGKGTMKGHLVAILSQKASEAFLAKKDDLANYLRRLKDEIQKLE